MEVIGAVSSVVALVETTSKLANTFIQLVQRWRNAPEEIEALARAIEDLATKFDYVRNTITSSPTTLVDDVIRQGLMQLVAKAETATGELNTLQKKLEAYDIFSQKAKWAVKDARTVKKGLAMIKDIEEGLSKWISFVSLNGHSLTLQHSQETQRILSVGLVELRQLILNMTPACPPGSPSGSAAMASPPTPRSAPTTSSWSTPRTTPRSLTTRLVDGLNWKSSIRLTSWGVCGSVVKSTQDQSADYDLGFTVHLPLAWLLGSYALRGELSIRRNSLMPNTFTLRHPGYFTVARILEDTHPFLEACFRNDVAAVRAMLCSGEGRPTDMDQEGRTCLYYAIFSDGLDVVSHLLDHGTDVDEATTSDRMSPLMVAALYGKTDILRMLLTRGASTDHLDQDGDDVYAWTLYCEHVTASVDLLKILVEHTLPPPNAIRGTYQTTALHQAARVGDAPAIDYLISLGFDVEQFDCQGFRPLYLAAALANADAYFSLVGHGARTKGLVADLLYFIHFKVESIKGQFPPIIKGVHDYDPIIKDLLCRCADLTTDFQIVDGKRVEFQGPVVPLLPIVAEYGPETEAWFLGLLEECGRLEDEDDQRRLQELRLDGHAAQGCIIGEVQEESEDEDGSEDAESLDDDGSGSYAHSEASDTEETDCFWDAEENV